MWGTGPTVKKEIKCCRDSQYYIKKFLILQKIVQTFLILYCITNYFNQYLGIPAINFISFLTVRGGVEGSLLPLVLQLGNTLGFSPKLVSQNCEGQNTAEFKIVQPEAVLELDESISKIKIQLSPVGPSINCILYLENKSFFSFFSSFLL